MNAFAGSKILVADDDRLFRVMLRQFLEKNEFQVCEAKNGQEAVDVFDRESPKMVLMDAEMPIMNGMAACKKIRKIDRDEYSPVLMVTAKDDDKFISEAFAAGASDYITKPIQWTVLKQRIQYKLKASQTAHELQESEERFRHLFEESPLPYLSLNDHGVIMDVNNAWLGMMGIPTEVVVGRSFENFMSEDNWRKFMHAFPNFIKSGSLSNMHLHMIDSSGKSLDVEINGLVAYDIHGHFKQTHNILQNVTERKLMEATLNRLATTDPLTGLYNRRAFFNESDRARLNAIRYKHPYSVMMLDIDHFKSINDSFGHDIGDNVLKLISKVMQKSLRDVDILGRLGGEEFAIVLPETSLDAAAEVAERIRVAIDVFQMNTDQGVVDIKISIGVTTLTSAQENNEALIKNADALLYQAKRNGRNRVER